MRNFVSNAVDKNLLELTVGAALPSLRYKIARNVGHYGKQELIKDTHLRLR